MHEDAGHYAGKHPEGTELNSSAAGAVKSRVQNERISCRAAHEAAAEIGVGPDIIGRTLDLLEIRITGCQLGLFGHKGGGEHGKAELKMPENAAEISRLIRQKAGNNGISCLELWLIADENGCTKPEAAAVCDDCNVNISGCQLGAF